jgi:hypothetical protein
MRIGLGEDSFELAADGGQRGLPLLSDFLERPASAAKTASFASVCVGPKARTNFRANANDVFARSDGQRFTRRHPNRRSGEQSARSF